jgi:hypothetical protein
MVNVPVPRPDTNTEAVKSFTLEIPPAGVPITPLVSAVAVISKKVWLKSWDPSLPLPYAEKVYVIGVAIAAAAMKRIAARQTICLLRVEFKSPWNICFL